MKITDVLIVTLLSSQACAQSVCRVEVPSPYTLAEEKHTTYQTEASLDDFDFEGELDAALAGGEELAMERGALQDPKLVVWGRRYVPRLTFFIQSYGSKAFVLYEDGKDQLTNWCARRGRSLKSVMLSLYLLAFNKRAVQNQSGGA